MYSAKCISQGVLEQRRATYKSPRIFHAKCINCFSVWTTFNVILYGWRIRRIRSLHWWRIYLYLPIYTDMKLSADSWTIKSINNKWIRFIQYVFGVRFVVFDMLSQVHPSFYIADATQSYLCRMLDQLLTVERSEISARWKKNYGFRSILHKFDIEQTHSYKSTKLILLSFSRVLVYAWVRYLQFGRHISMLQFQFIQTQFTFRSQLTA